MSIHYLSITTLTSLSLHETKHNLPSRLCWGFFQIVEAREGKGRGTGVGSGDGKSDKELTGIVVYEVIANLWVICFFPS